MKIFVTGISGLLGLNFALQMRGRHEISGAFRTHPVSIDGVRALDLDVCAPKALERLLLDLQPDVVLHTAGLTSVEGCEERPDLAVHLNVEAARAAAHAAYRAGAAFVHLSTDQLFDGSVAFVTEATKPAPLNVYGRTKLAAEQIVRGICSDALVVRTNFFGWGTSVRTSFSDWIIGALERGETLTMFDDAYFTPILVNDLIDRIVALVERAAEGIINIGGSERLTKYAFALRVAQVFGAPADKIVGRPLDTFRLRARRPKDMSLSTDKVGALLGEPMPQVTPALERLRQLREESWPARLEQALENAPAV